MSDDLCVLGVGMGINNDEADAFNIEGAVSSLIATYTPSPLESVVLKPPFAKRGLSLSSRRKVEDRSVSSATRGIVFPPGDTFGSFVGSEAPPNESENEMTEDSMSGGKDDMQNTLHERRPVEANPYRIVVGKGKKRTDRTSYDPEDIDEDNSLGSALQGHKNA